MDAGSESLPDDIEELKAALVAARAEVASARAQRSDDQALIAHLKLQIEKLRRRIHRREWRRGLGYACERHISKESANSATAVVHEEVGRDSS